MDKMNLSLIIADDEQIIREGLVNSVNWEELGITVVGFAKNGKEALDLAREIKPDLIITDIKMPIMDGLSLCRHLYEDNFTGKVIVLSGFNDFSYAQTAMRYNVHDYLLKPLALSELTSCVTKARDELLSKRSENSINNDRLVELEKAQKSAYKRQLIRDLIQNSISKDKLHNIQNNYNISIKDVPSQVALIKPVISFNSKSEVSIATLLPHIKAELDVFLNDNITSILDKDTIAVIFNGESKCTSAETLLKTFIDEMSIANEVNVFAAIGSSTNIDNLSFSYKEARELLEYHIYYENARLLDISLKDEPEPPSNIISKLKTDKIFDAILLGDKNSALEHFADLFQIIMYTPTPAPNFLYSMCNYILIDIHKQLVRHLNADLSYNAGDFYNALQNLGTISAISDWILSVLADFTNEVELNAASRIDPIIKQSIEYCQNHIAEKIKIEDVCYHVGLSKSYFTTYFKTKTNINFRDYVLDMKISYAQSQLKNPDVTPTQLALQLGYDDYRSFNRAFKARTATTPSDYQKKYVR